MEKILIIGSSGHAEIVIDTVEREGRYEIAGLLDDYRPVGEQLFGYPVLGKHGDAARVLRDQGAVGGIVGIGDNWTRACIWEEIRARAPDFLPVTAVHPSAQVARCSSLGPGTLVMVGGIVNPGARTGMNCVISTNSSLDHDSAMGDHASLSGKVATGGNVTIGRYTAVMLDVTIAHGVTIGEHTVVGAGSLVMKDLPGYCVAYGTPATVVRPRDAGDPYL